MSACPVPFCFERCPIGVLSLENKEYHEPFCIAHMPKCKCGKIRYTFSKIVVKYPLNKNDLIHFSESCKKCEHVCTIIGCFKTDPYSFGKYNNYDKFHYIEHTCIDRRCKCPIKWPEN